MIIKLTFVIKICWIIKVYWYLSEHHCTEPSEPGLLSYSHNAINSKVPSNSKFQTDEPVNYRTCPGNFYPNSQATNYPQP